jgi:hypothetical protein
MRPDWPFEAAPQPKQSQMDDASQIRVPERFVQIFVEPGRIRPRLSRSEIETRHELCEDLAQMLCDTAREQCWSLNITLADALERIALGLPECGLDLELAERDWVVARVNELLDDFRLRQT